MVIASTAQILEATLKARIRNVLNVLMDVKIVFLNPIVELVNQGTLKTINLMKHFLNLIRIRYF
jgi:hypothetical protein